MPENSSIDWKSLSLAREKLVAQIGNHPDVSLIDIGVDPQSQAQAGTLVIRVHVRGQETTPGIPIAGQIDGVRVVMVPGKYRLE
jgi:hypothetical protein